MAIGIVEISGDSHIANIVIKDACYEFVVLIHWDIGKLWLTISQRYCRLLDQLKTRVIG